jgi:hypothetical protein
MTSSPSGIPVLLAQGMESQMTPDTDSGRSLTQTLAEAFDAFEAIRQLARGCEDSTPELLPAFMSAASASADGRDAIMTAPALRDYAGTAPSASPLAACDDDPRHAADAIASLAVTLAASLDDAAALAMTSEDGRACDDAAAAALHIYQLMAPGR